VWIYHQPLPSFAQTIGPIGVAGTYAAAAYILRSRFRIDVGLRRRQDVFRYLLVSLSAGVVSTVIGTVSLLADHAILWPQLWDSARSWFFGDAIGALGVAPFLLVHVLPWVRRKVFGADDSTLALATDEPPLSLASVLEVAGQAVALVATLWFMF